MRFDTLTGKDLGSLNHFAIDFRELPEGVIAITGGNGAGKTTLLGALLAGIYRELPTRGSLVDMATSRECRVSVGLTHGARTYLLTQLADGVSRKGEASVVERVSGFEPTLLVDTGKVSDVAEWVGKTLPSLDLVLASMFTAQRSRGFLDMKPGARKDLLLELLGIEALEGKARAARGNAAEALREVDRKRAKLQAAERGPSYQETAAHRRNQQEALSAAEANVDGCQRVLEQRRVQALEAERHNAGLDTKLAAQRAAQEALVAATSRLRALEGRLPRLRELVGNAEAIRVAAATVAECEQQRVTWEKLKEAERAAVKVAARYDLSPLRSAVAMLPKLEEDHAGATRRLAESERNLAELADQRAAGAAERIEALRSAIGAMGQCLPDRWATAVDIGCSALETDDAVATRARVLPVQLEAARAAHRENQEAERVTRLALAGAREAEKQLPAAEAAHADYDTARAALVNFVPPTSADEPTVRLAAQLEDLARAEATLAELEPQVAEAEKLVAKCRADFEAFDWPAIEPLPVPDLAPARAALARAEADLTAAAQKVALAEDAVKRAQETEAEANALRSALATQEAELGDWNRLGADLGKDGLQAMLVDAALPELSSITNELLREAFGPRFSVELRTQAPDAKGKRLLETLDVAVIDSERGRDTVVETLSGGEQVIVGEALSLALSLVTLRAAGISDCTLVRDESGSALDPERAHAYVAMLRRAQKMIGARQVLLVSHMPEVQQLCDARLLVANGTVEIARD